MSEIRFTIVTDDPVVGMLYLFGITPDEWPRFIAVLDDPVAISMIPDGAKCRGIFFSNRDSSLAEKAWRDRRGRGGLVWISEEEADRIMDWLTRRDAARLQPPFTPVARKEPELQQMPLSQRWT